MSTRIPLVLTAAMAFGLLFGCDGPNEQAGKRADAAAGLADSPLKDGPNEEVGEARDRAAKDEGRAIEAQADSAEDRADEVRSSADQQADALEQRAAEIREQAKQTGTTLDQQADAIRGK